MKAAVLHALGDLRYEDVPVPEIAAGEVLVKVRAAGVCGSDIPRVMKKGTYSFPLVPGHELAGEVAQVGDDVSASFSVGDRVTVFPLIPCGRCAYCKIGEYAQCDDYDYLGSRRDGGFAEYVAAPADNLVLIPDNVDFDSAAMAEPASVALHALRRTGVDAGDSVAILGAGPIGIILAQWARICGAGRVFLTDIVDEKLNVAKGYGFADCINATQEDAVQRIVEETDGRGADICVEAAGTPVTFEQSLRIARKLGKVILMGNVTGDVVIPERTASAVLRGQLTIYGTWNSSFTAVPKNEWRTALQFMSSGALDLKPLITHRFKLDQVNNAFDMMYNNRVFFNKAMFVFR
jgi:L-iditol 2-dehydrogenase